MGTLSYMDANGVWQTTQDGSTGVELTDGIIETKYLADNAVTTIKILDGNVTDSKILSVSGSKVTGPLDGTIISPGTITADKIAEGSITSNYLDSSVNSTINSAYSIADSKNTVYYAPSKPVGSTYKIGDTWFDTDDGNHIYVYDGTDFKSAQDADIAAAHSLAMGKNTMYYSASEPTGSTYITGDMWIDTANGNRLNVYNGSDWIIAQDTDIAAAKAAADAAVTSYVIEYASNSSETVAPTTGWSTVAPTRTPGTFIWTRTKVTYGSGSTSTTNAVLITGNTGLQGPAGYTPVKGTDYFDGIDGQDGVSSYVWVRYGTSAAGAGMTTNPAGMTYIGVATTTTAVAPSTAGSYTWSLIKGDQGIQGETGANGLTSYLHIKYSDDGTTFTANGGETVGAYIGTYVDFTAADSTSFSAYTWNRVKGEQGPQGLQGLQGLQGIQGIQGPAGADGASSYTHIAYSTSPTGATGFSTSVSTDKTYIGMYVDNNPIDSETPSSYAWTLIKGADGEQGIPGPAGADGLTPYLHIAYATNATGTTGFSTTDSVNKTYIGQYVDNTAADSTNPALYSWTLIKGADGSNAKLVSVLADTQVLTSPAAGGATTPATATVTGTTQNTTITAWTYSIDGAVFSATVPAGVSRTNNVVTITGQTMTAKTISVKMEDASGIADTVTVAKVFNGADGAAASAGADAYTVLLSNESHTFPGSISAALAGSTTSTVISYKGATAIASTVGTITGQVTGLTTAVTNNGTTTPLITITVTTALVTKSGTLTVPITVDGKSFTKTISWAVAYTGATGSTGPQGTTGVSVSSITVYYLQQASATPPAKPTLNPPGGSWVTTEPAYVANTYLFKTERVVYSNSTFAYTDVSLVSSYTAASLAMTAANSKNKIYYQIAEPSGGTYLVGDLWFDTDNGNKPYIYNGSTWVANVDSSPGSPLAIANSKNQVYYQDAQPTGGVYLKGDLWFDTNDNYKQYVYTGSAWQLAQDAYAAQTLATTAMQTADSKNKIIYSTLNPSGTGFVAGDMWYKTGTDATTGQAGILTLYTYTKTGTNPDVFSWVAQTLTDSVVGNLTANKLTTGTLNANLIAVNTLNGDRITANTLTASKLVTGTITAASGVIADAAITTAKIGDLQVTDAKIGSVNATKIVAAWIEAGTIKVNSIDGTAIKTNTLTTNQVVGTFGTDLNISSNASVTVLARKDGLIGYINVSPEAITINADRININGALEISNWADTTDVTKIDGGKIYTGSITSEQIRTGSITAASGIIASIDASVITTGTLNASQIVLTNLTPDDITGTIPLDKLSTAVQTTIGSVSNKVDATTFNTLSTTVENTETAINTIANAINIASNVTNAIKIDATTGITIQQYENGTSKYAINLDGNSLDFIEAGFPVATIQGQMMEIPRAKITSELQSGAHTISKSGEQTVFRWIG